MTDSFVDTFTTTTNIATLSGCLSCEMSELHMIGAREKVERAWRRKVQWLCMLNDAPSALLCMLIMHSSISFRW